MVDNKQKNNWFIDVYGIIVFGAIGFWFWNATDGCSCSKRSIDDGGSSYDEPFVPR